MSQLRTHQRISYGSFVILLLLCTTLSCQRQQLARDYLLDVEEVMETNPDSARRLLDAWPDAQRLTGENQALYAILRTQTDYKCYKPITDSLPLIATRYYGIPRHKNYHAAMAWYSLGCYYTTMRADSLGIITYLNARDLFPNTTSKYYRRTIQNLGQHYHNKNMLDNAIDAFESYYRLAKEENDSTQVATAVFYLGDAQMRKFNYATADSLFVEVLNTPPTPFHAKTALLDRAKIKIFYNKDYGTALDMLRTYRKLQANDNLCGAGFCFMGMCFQHLNQLDSARYYFDKSRVNPDIYAQYNTFRGLTEVSLLKKDEAEIFDYFDRFRMATDSILKQRDIEHISGLGIAHELENEKKELAYHAQLLRTALLLVSVIAILLIAFIITLRKSLQKSRTLAVHEFLRRSELDAARKEGIAWRELSPEKKKEKLVNYSAKLSQCRLLFRETASDKILFSWQKEDSSVKRNNQNKTVTGGVRTQVIDDIGQTFIDVIQDLILDTYPEAPRLIESDWLYCILSYLRVSQKRISELLSLQPNSIRRKKMRLEPKVPAEILNLFFKPSSMQEGLPPQDDSAEEEEPPAQANEENPSCLKDE